MLSIYSVAMCDSTSGLEADLVFGFAQSRPHNAKDHGLMIVALESAKLFHLIATPDWLEELGRERQLAWSGNYVCMLQDLPSAFAAGITVDP